MLKQHILINVTLGRLRAESLKTSSFFNVLVLPTITFNVITSCQTLSQTSSFSLIDRLLTCLVLDLILALLLILGVHSPSHLIQFPVHSHLVKLMLRVDLLIRSIVYRNVT
jgi:hypothetical protein